MEPFLRSSVPSVGGLQLAHAGCVGELQRWISLRSAEIMPLAVR